MLPVWHSFCFITCFILTWFSQQRERSEVLIQPVNEVNASAPDHRKHRSRWRISVLPAFFGVFPGTFLLTTWFCRMFGILIIDWNTLEFVAWPFIVCYRLFRKAPPWVFWKALPLGLQILEYCCAVLRPISLFVSQMITYHDLGSPSLSNFADKHLSECIQEPPQCCSIGSFPLAQQYCFTAVPSNRNSDSAREQSRSVLTNSGLENVTCSLTFDTGASQCITGVKSDFLEFFPEGAQHSVIKGIAQGLTIDGEGIVEYTLTCEDGSTVTIRAKAYFVPDLGFRRLISPQGIRSAEGNPCVFNNPTNDQMDPDSIPELHIMPKHPHWRRSPPERIVPARYHPLTKLPTAQASIATCHTSHHEALAMSIDVTDTHNANLSDAQKTLLMLHYRLGHVGFRHIQWLIRARKLSVRNAKNVEKCDLPKCAACLYAKMRKRPTQATHSPTPREDKEMNLRVGDLLPGQRVSVDHFESSQPGRMYSTKTGSKAATYCGGAIFVDHATGFISVQHQQTFGAADTIKAKLQFERTAFDDGVVVQDYHTDNGVFSAKEFLNELVTKGQRIRFAGSGAAHQNGIAERSILTITGMARTMLLHAALRHGGSHIHQDLWPQAIDDAVWLFNRIPRTDSGLSPLEMWSRSAAMNIADTLGNCHVWGCPTFVLEPKLRKNGVKIPRWAPRSRQGVNLGFSRLHSSLVALVLNPTTKSITTQFHVVFDDAFSTVPHNGEIDPTSWQSLITVPQLEDGNFHNVRLQTPLDPADNPELDDEWLAPD